MDRTAPKPPAIVVMGVSGSGKSTVGELLVGRLGAAFIEGDRFHLPASIAKMSAGIPLTDDDRWPWLDAVGREIARLAVDGPVVAACSALKRAYRDRLRDAAGVALLFVYLDGSRALIGARMAARAGHFFPDSLLDSQFAALESPGDDELHVVVQLPLSAEGAVTSVMTALHSL